MVGGERGVTVYTAYHMHKGKDRCYWDCKEVGVIELIKPISWFLFIFLFVCLNIHVVLQYKCLCYLCVKISPTERVVHSGSQPRYGSVSNHGGVDVSLLCLWCVASHRFCVFITPRNGTNKQKRTESDQNVLFFAIFGNDKWKIRTQNARVDSSARVCRAPPLCKQVHEYADAWIKTLTNQLSLLSHWGHPAGETREELSFQRQNKLSSDDMLYRLLACLVLLAIMRLLIKAVETCWEISKCSSPSNLVGAVRHKNPLHIALVFGSPLPI